MVAIGNIIIRLIEIYQYVIIIWALLTWLPGAAQSQFGYWVNRVVEPYISVFDRFIPTIGGISLNALVGIFILDLVKRGVAFLILSFLR